MAAAIGSVATSLLSAINENTLALSSLKFDFSLIKVEAPAEFKEIGSCLSNQRRDDAENGPAHKTARRLGALFEQIIPSTPRLITAYGERVSEIIKTPGVNPEGSSTHGPFQSFVGADGTALWAAATSGVSALGIYLLACLLARAWDTKESISIWVELVAARRREIVQAAQTNNLISESSCFAAQQEISRQDLALWDLSARSWLRSADEAKDKKQHQLMLILKNIDIPFTGGPSTYVKVIEAWREAMNGMESLLSGQPQSISTGSILLALSAWHLYPDLIVIGKELTSVPFHDSLVPSGGVATIGLQYMDGHGSRWSLALSHLQYYGGPVTVESNKDSSRVTIEQLHIVTLGSLLAVWDIRNSRMIPAVQWFIDFWTVVEQMNGIALSQLYSWGPQKFQWISNLGRAARKVIDSKNDQNSTCKHLLNYGHRRAKTFLTKHPRKSAPFFGLCNPSVLEGLKEDLDIECGIRYLRNIAQILELREDEAVIRYIWKDSSRPGDVTEYATAVPHRRVRPQRLKDKPETELVHARWLNPAVLNLAQNPTLPPSPDKSPQRMYELSMREECGMLAYSAPTAGSNLDGEGSLEWDGAPQLYRHKYGTSAEPYCCTSLQPTGTLCKCFNTYYTSGPNETRVGERSSQFRLIVGNWDLGLYITTDTDDPRLYKDAVAKRTKAVLKQTIEPSRYDPFPVAEINKKLLSLYLSCLFTPQLSGLHLSPQYEILGTNLLAGSFREGDTSVFESLQALAVASRLYERLEGATISLRLVTHTVHLARWACDSSAQYRTTSIHEIGNVFETVVRGTAVRRALTRTEAFACISMFESGFLDISPLELRNTLAVCSENSIYAAVVILSDPFEITEQNAVRRIIGNIGHTGICMLVAPKEPQIRPLSDTFDVVNHAPYDFRRENSFKGTSLHLSFTDWTLPLDTQASRTIDHNVLLVEAVISVQDSGKWVADLDILGVDFDRLTLVRDEGNCSTHRSKPIDLAWQDKEEADTLISLDSWDELLDRQDEGICVFRAHENWAARLAAVSVLSQQGLASKILVCGSSTCHGCMKDLESMIRRKNSDKAKLWLVLLM